MLSLLYRQYHMWRRRSFHDFHLAAGVLAYVPLEVPDGSNGTCCECTENKIKRLLQESAEDLEFDTGETEQKALIETSDIVTMFARLAKVYGSYSYSQPSGVEMFKMVGVVVLRIKQLEAEVKNLEKRDDKKDAFKRAILVKAGGISRGDMCASTTCLASSEQYSGLVIDNSSSWKTGGRVQIWSQTALRTFRTRPPLEPLRSCQICTIPV